MRQLRCGSSGSEVSSSRWRELAKTRFDVISLKHAVWDVYFGATSACHQHMTQYRTIIISLRRTLLFIVRLLSQWDSTTRCGQKRVKSKMRMCRPTWWNYERSAGAITRVLRTMMIEVSRERRWRHVRVMNCDDISILTFYCLSASRMDDKASCSCETDAFMDWGRNYF